MLEAVLAYFKEDSQDSEIWGGDNLSLRLHIGRVKPAFAAEGMEEAAVRGRADRVIYIGEGEVVKGAHRFELDQEMTRLCRIRQADLTIVDAIIGMEGQGPVADTPREMNLITAGTDTIATDAVTANIMGIKQESFQPFGAPVPTALARWISTGSRWWIRA